MENFGLAGGGDILVTDPSHQLFVGEAPVWTDSAEASIVIVRYQVVGLEDDGTLGAAPAEGQKAVIAAIAGGIGDRVPYYAAGRFNHAVLVWPAGMDTLDERKAYFEGTPISVGHTLP